VKKFQRGGRAIPVMSGKGSGNVKRNKRGKGGDPSCTGTKETLFCVDSGNHEPGDFYMHSLLHQNFHKMLCLSKGTSQDVFVLLFAKRFDIHVTCPKKRRQLSKGFLRHLSIGYENAGATLPFVPQLKTISKIFIPYGGFVICKCQKRDSLLYSCGYHILRRTLPLFPEGKRSRNKLMILAVGTVHGAPSGTQRKHRRSRKIVVQRFFLHRIHPPGKRSSVSQRLQTLGGDMFANTAKTSFFGRNTAVTGTEIAPDIFLFPMPPGSTPEGSSFRGRARTLLVGTPSTPHDALP
jgi:hypothetical protein